MEILIWNNGKVQDNFGPELAIFQLYNHEVLLSQFGETFIFHRELQIMKAIVRSGYPVLLMFYKFFYQLINS